MKKARTLLAIWLALILTLTLFPTALADGEGDTSNGGSGQPPTEPIATRTVTWNVDEGITVTPAEKLTSVSAAEPFTFSFKANEGYEITSVEFKTDSATQRNDLNGLNPTADGTYSYGFEPGKDAISITIKAAKKQPEDPDPIEPQPQPKTYKLTFSVSSNEATLPEGWKNTIETDVNGKVTIPPGEPSLKDHYFMGWFADASQHGLGSDVPSYHSAGDSLTLTDNVTLTASLLHGITVNFAPGSDADDVKNLPETMTNQKPESALTISAPTREGYNFKGWSASGGTVSGTSYTLPRTVRDNAVTLTATWEPATKITIDYDRGQAKTASIPTDTFVYQPADGSAATFTISRDKPSRHDGSYSFSGWRYSVDNKLYNPGNTITIPAGTTSVKLTAEWSPATYPDYDEDDDRPSKPSRPSKPTYDEYRIRATCSDGGWVSPAGSNYVREGRNLTVTFAPYKGYAIDGVYIDGVLDNRYDGSYTFRDVDENHTIYVRYVRDSGSSGGSSGGGSHWDDDTSPKTGDTSAPLSMGLGVGSLALIAFLVARKMRRA